MSITTPVPAYADDDRTYLSGPLGTVSLHLDPVYRTLTIRYGEAYTAWRRQEDTVALLRDMLNVWSDDDAGYSAAAARFDIQSEHAGALRAELAHLARVRQDTWQAACRSRTEFANHWNKLNPPQPTTEPTDHEYRHNSVR